MRENPAPQTEVFVKINECAELPPDKLHLNLNVVTLKDGAPAPIHVVMLQMNEQTKRIVTSENGMARDVDVVFQRVQGVRSKLRVWAKGAEEQVSEYEILTDEFETFIRSQLEAKIGQKNEEIQTQNRTIQELRDRVASMEPAAQAHWREKERKDEENNEWLGWIKKFYEQIPTIKPEWARVCKAFSPAVLEKIKKLYKPMIIILSFDEWIIIDDVTEIPYERRDIKRSDTMKYLQQNGLGMLKREQLIIALERQGINYNMPCEQHKNYVNANFDHEKIFCSDGILTIGCKGAGNKWDNSSTPPTYNFSYKVDQGYESDIEKRACLIRSVFVKLN